MTCALEKQNQESGNPPPNTTRTHQNNYTLTSKRPFDEIKIRIQIRNIMEMNLREWEYSDQAVPDLCLLLAGEIISAIKENNFDRYRFVVNVFIGQKKMQGINIAHSFLWDHEKDRFVEYIYDQPSFFVQAIVYGVFYE